MYRELNKQWRGGIIFHQLYHPAQRLTEEDCRHSVTKLELSRWVRVDCPPGLLGLWSYGKGWLCEGSHREVFGVVGRNSPMLIDMKSYLLSSVVCGVRKISCKDLKFSDRIFLILTMYLKELIPHQELKKIKLYIPEVGSFANKNRKVTRCLGTAEG